MPELPKLTERTAELVGVWFEAGLHPDFLLLHATADFLKAGRTVVYVSATRVLESIRVACNKLSIRLTAVFRFLAVGELLGERLLDERTMRETIVEGESRNVWSGVEGPVLLVVDNLSAVCFGDTKEEIRLIEAIRRLLNAESTVVYCTSTLPDAFIGQWDLERSENFDEFLSEKGVNWIIRKLILLASVSKTFQKGDQPDRYTYYSNSTKENSAEIPEKFLHSWEVDKSENFDEYLTAKGYGWFMRQMVKLASIQKIFEKNADKPGTYNCKIYTSKKNVEWIGWQVDKEFQAEYLDDAQHKITFSYNGAEDKLIEKHIVVDKPDEKPDVYEYTINKDGFLVMRMEFNGVVTNRFYKKSSQ
ncbi:putative effector protein [Aphelenchoides fujianensis]|nr:putative effector protein [Aphelenchoides fujianensis]